VLSRGEPVAGEVGVGGLLEVSRPVLEVEGELLLSRRPRLANVVPRDRDRVPARGVLGAPLHEIAEQPHRRIDWKATARTRQLTVREFAAEDEKRATIIFDNRIPKENGKTVPLREKISAEQTGKPVVASEKFEAGASLAASLLAQFVSEHAEIRLVIDSDIGEYGVGRSHFHESLKLLALAEPNFAPDAASSELEINIERILNEKDGSHRFLITANGTAGLSPDLLQRLKIIGF